MVLFWLRFRCSKPVKGGFDQFAFYNAFHAYNNGSIDDSLASPNPVIRLFAIFDKRVGKRRLQKILSEDASFVQIHEYSLTIP